MAAAGTPKALADRVKGLMPELTAVLYRVATFYLPPLWGFFAMRWLQRRSLL